ncbi:mu DNA-binding domain protein [Neisseria musculi]|uniref:Mu DNA-binding domain protein n=1 Tax=Neisseria musculi TaxID=1815583 RepID=A0A7H1MB78_9NEIS|nr:mu DNA-binding domain protein [Neisseria musculi]
MRCRLGRNLFKADLEEAVHQYNFEHEHRSLPKDPETGTLRRWGITNIG